MDAQTLQGALSALSPQSNSETPASDPTPPTTSPTPSDEAGSTTSASCSAPSRSLVSLLSETASPKFRRKVLELDETTHAGRRIALFVESWTKAAARNKRDRGTWLVVAGPTGVGKSHSLRRAYRFLANHNVDLWAAGLWTGVPSAVFATWSRIVDLPRDEWDDWLYDLRRAAFVFLDDVGSEVDRFKSGEPMERLRVVLETCGDRWLIMSTNLVPSRWNGSVDARVASRLSRAAVLDLTGAEDYRPRLKGAA